MLEFKKILVPYDGSSYAKKALAVAADTARLIPGAELFIATVAPAEEPKKDNVPPALWYSQHRNKLH